MLRRRSLLRSALGSACLPGLLPAPAAAQRTGTGTDYDVLIMGAGVAGLATAAALLRPGHDLKVLVLEARQRLGGRVHSIPRRELAWDVELGSGYLQPPQGAGWQPLADLGLRAEAVAAERLRLFPGMRTLVTALAGASTGLVQLDCTVTEVLWRQGLIGVYYRNRGLESAVTARRMVCALPAPLLGGPRGPRFSPRLPRDKREALQSLSFDAIVKVALLLPAEAVDPALLAGGDAWERADRGSLLRARPAGERGEWLLEASYSGARAARLAGRSEAQLCAGTLGEFVALLGIANEVEVLWQAAADWAGDPYAGAAITRRGAAGVHRTLAAGLDNTLFFAGEATAEPEAVGTVHGAFLSGERAALEVAASLGLPRVPESEGAGEAEGDSAVA